ncbi:MAG: hypothetical protein AB7I50_20460 [Vicinamibacterales bacterium]
MRLRLASLFIIGSAWFTALTGPASAATITQWNFNSVPADASTSSGTTSPSTGSGTAGLIGGTTSTFASGDANGGSTDPATGDDSGWNLATFATQGTGSGSRGVQFTVSTAGKQNIIVTWDHRHSNTSSRYVQFQYSTDGTTFVDFGSPLDHNAGDTWFNTNTVNLSSIAAVNDNPNFAFRIVAVFAPSTAAYAPANTGSTYGTSGTWRFDMVTVSGDNVGAPTIQETSATPFFNLPATGPGSVSGVISDPTDPAATIGIDFTIADVNTPVGSLTVTASSDDPAVVPNANLNLTGAGASRNLKITPAAVGLATITMTVSDGVDSSSYIINYAASAASVNPSTTRFHTGTSDASTAVSIDSDYMFVADDEDQTIRLYDRNESGLPLASFDFTASLGLSGSSEVDIEASTRVGNTIYWLGSHSNNSTGENRDNRERIFATTVAGAGAASTLTFVDYYAFLEDDLIAWDNANGHGLGAGALGLAASAADTVLPEQSAGFNIEGLVMAPGSSTIAYVAFRAPMEPTATRASALIVPVTNFAALMGAASGSATFGAPIFLNLGGRAIRSIERNASDHYLIVAARRAPRPALRQTTSGSSRGPAIPPTFRSSGRPI